MWYADDEIFQAGSILLNYPNDIDLFVTHPTDCISESRYMNQRTMFYQCMNLVNEYREKRDFPKINYKLYEYASFNGYMSDEGRKAIQSDLEKSFEISLIDNCWTPSRKIDYFVFTEESTHQSHQECNHIAGSICRSPFIEQCKDIMLATYPQSEYGIRFNSENHINSYLPISEEQADILCHCIGNIYKEKNSNSTILGADNFKTYLQFFGSRCGKDYAQPFMALRHIYTLGS